MDSVMMTSPGNSTRLKTRLRNATFLARNLKGRRNHHHHHSTLNNNNHINQRNNRNRTNNNSGGNVGGVKQMNSINKSLGQDSNGNSTTTAAVVRNVNGTYKGKFAREVYNAICLRLGPTPHIPGDSVQALFNDMQLYPSKAQVSEMLQIARQCGNRNGGPQILTFGEFCVYLREMQTSKQHRKAQQTTKQNNKCTSSNCEVFLGGSCNPTTWRTDTAIPELKKQGITFYNPQVTMWAPELVAQEHDAKQSASVLLYVVDSQTRSTGGMIEVGYLVASGRCVVLVAQPYKLGQTIMGEVLSRSECLELIKAQCILLMLVKSRGIKVHDNLKSALQCTANLLRNSSATNGMTAEEQVTHKLKKLREAFDSCDTNRRGELCINGVLDAYYKLTNRSLRISDLYSYLSTSMSSDPSRLRVSFEQFCALVAEFSTDGCDVTTTTTTTDERASQPVQQHTCTINNNSPPDVCQTTTSQCNTDQTTPPTPPQTSPFDIYLGGCCDTTCRWKEDIAIPLIEKHGLTYYNPALREVHEERIVLDRLGDAPQLNPDHYKVLEKLVLNWKRCLDRSSVLLFVITADTRSLTTMILASYYIGMGREVVLCVQPLPGEDCQISGEKLSKQAIKDYNRGRIYLTDLAKRKQIPVFENITEAVNSAISKCEKR